MSACDAGHFTELVMYPFILLKYRSCCGGGIAIRLAVQEWAGRRKVNRRVILMALAIALLGAGPASSESEPEPSWPPIIQAKDRAELIEKFCAADSNLETILVLPASLFVDAEQMICDSGPYKLYRIIEATDTDDFEYFLDPPIYGQANRLGCDGKAGRTQKIVAINCRPLK
jgi:hypothetical protein